MRVGHYLSPEARERYRRAYDDVVAGLPSPQVGDVPTPYGDVRVLTCAGPAGRVPLVLLPGAGAPGASWSALVPALTAERTVHLLDPLGGPGGSRQVVPLATMADQAHWLRAVVDALGAPAARSGGVHLGGASMGGRIVFELVRRDPSGITSLALADPANTFARMPAKLVALSVGAQPWAPRWLRERFLHSVGGGADVDAEPVGRLLTAGLDCFATAQPFPSLPSEDEVRGVGVPTLVLLGGRSVLLDAGRARARAALLPRGTVEVWPDAGHALADEFPERTAAAFLAHAARAEA
ncbi:alpha/beta fold hydrolase [Pseudonocardia phyllosphaerae]|uniref:alpha/beta fold hydrolase n=1 Tax=Pseudonocardia phyllosphaerae TaxID=3390502 RepID=UPI00397E1E37